MGGAFPIAEDNFREGCNYDLLEASISSTEGEVCQALMTGTSKKSQHAFISFLLKHGQFKVVTLETMV